MGGEGSWSLGLTASLGPHEVMKGGSPKEEMPGSQQTDGTVSTGPFRLDILYVSEPLMSATSPRIRFKQLGSRYNF